MEGAEAEQEAFRLSLEDAEKQHGAEGGDAGPSGSTAAPSGAAPGPLGATPASEGLPLQFCGDDEKRHRIERMLHNAPCGLVLTDCEEPDNPIVYVNRIFEFITGYSAMEILGRNCRFLQYRGAYARDRHELVDKKVIGQISDAIRKREEFYGVLLNFRKNGAPMYNTLFLTPLCADVRNPGVVTHFAGVQTFRTADIDLGPLPPKPPTWLPDRVTGDQVQQVMHDRWLSGNEQRDDLPWLDILGDQEAIFLLCSLNMKALAAIGCTCRRLRRLGSLDVVWERVCQRLWGDSVVASMQREAQNLGWRRIAREMYTLEALTWRRRVVAGNVRPMRTNFSTCSVDSKIVIFGGEAAHAAALNDTYLLDLDQELPTWTLLEFPADAPRPPCRWGHTLRQLRNGTVVLFGGCNRAGPMNDVWQLDVNSAAPRWHKMDMGPQLTPLPRSWHGACTIQGTELVIFGGCSSTGRLLNDTWRLNLGDSGLSPTWEQLSHNWNPPSRLGLSLVATEDQRIFLFGGLASAGPVRLRSQDAFTMNLQDAEPTWQYVTGSQLPSGAMAAGTPPQPRLEHVTGTIAGGRIMVFGGSVNGDGQHPLSQPFVLSPNAENPTWQTPNITGTGPSTAWGYSATMVGSTRFVMPGSYDNGSLVMTELYELWLVSQNAAPDRGAPQRISGQSNTANELMPPPPREPGPPTKPPTSGSLGSSLERSSSASERSLEKPAQAAWHNRGNSPPSGSDESVNSRAPGAQGPPLPPGAAGKAPVATAPAAAPPDAATATAVPSPGERGAGDAGPSSPQEDSAGAQQQLTAHPPMQPGQREGEWGDVLMNLEARGLGPERQLGPVVPRDPGHMESGGSSGEKNNSSDGMDQGSDGQGDPPGNDGPVNKSGAPSGSHPAACSPSDAGVDPDNENEPKKLHYRQETDSSEEEGRPRRKGYRVTADVSGSDNSGSDGTNSDKGEEPEEPDGTAEGWNS